MQLSEHFSLRELTRSDKADELGDPNTPTAEHLRTMQTVLAPGLEQVRAICGNRPIRIESGYRNPRVNKAVGGVPNSDHALGYAADIQIDGVDDLVVAKAIRDSDLKFDQLIREIGRTVHISFHPRMRRQVMRQPGGPGTPCFEGLE